MIVKTLYRYEREPGKITVSTDKPDKEYTEIYRLIADDGKMLTDGEITTGCVDVFNTEGWAEIDTVEGAVE